MSPSCPEGCVESKLENRVKSWRISTTTTTSDGMNDIGKAGGRTQIRIHRFRHKKLPNGDYYNCEFVDNKPDGYGTFTSRRRDGNRDDAATSSYPEDDNDDTFVIMTYDGSFYKGLFHGEGIQTWDRIVDGYKYGQGQGHGDNRDKNIHGLTEIETKAGMIRKTFRRFEGMFNNGQRHGFGVLQDYDTSRRWEGEWKGNKLNGKGDTIDVAQGSREIGTFVNNRLHCNDAVVINANGSRYEGCMRYGKKHGATGHYSYKDHVSVSGNGNGSGKSFYTGSWHQNLMHGIGTRRYIDGSTFRGDIVRGKICGHGTMHYGNETCMDEKSKYTGSWMDGTWHGYGELIYGPKSNCDSYEGEFYKGIFHGKGKLKYRNGRVYDGYFKSGMRNGKGQMIWASGNTFDGEWTDDLMSEGRYTDVSHGSIYIGTFKNNKKDGIGAREIWQSPPVKGGCFKDPFFGSMQDANGISKYSGAYKDGYFHGEGKFEAADGRSYEGEWKRGKPDGFGKMKLLKKTEFGDPNRMYIGRHGSLYRPVEYIGTWQHGKRKEGKLLFSNGSSRVWNQ